MFDHHLAPTGKPVLDRSPQWLLANITGPSHPSQETTAQPLPRDGRFMHRGVAYASASEAACANFLVRYVPDFRIVPGETFQINLGKNHRGDCYYADFRVGDTFVEYHPPRLWNAGKKLGDFDSYKQRSEYYRTFYRCHGRSRAILQAEMRETLSDQYYNKRRELIDCSPTYRGAPLVVVKNAGELYDQVLKQQGDFLPARVAFVAMFDQLKMDIYRNNRIQR